MSTRVCYPSFLFCVVCLLACFGYLAVGRPPSARHAITVIRVVQQGITLLEESRIPAGTLRKIEDRLSRALQALSEKRYQEAMDVGMQADALIRRATERGGSLGEEDPDEWN